MAEGTSEPIKVNLDLAIQLLITQVLELRNRVESLERHLTGFSR